MQSSLEIIDTASSSLIQLHQLASSLPFRQCKLASKSDFEMVLQVAVPDDH
jgi:hypothetical protein